MPGRWGPSGAVSTLDLQKAVCVGVCVPQVPRWIQDPTEIKLLSWTSGAIYFIGPFL